MCPLGTEDPADDGPCPRLVDSLASATQLWDGATDAPSPHDGIGAVSTWVRAHLWFNSSSKRSEYPTIALSHACGRCGEHGNVTAAVARTALIPTRVAWAYANDHAWNEFFDGERWVHFEPAAGAIDSPKRYDDSIGDGDGVRVVTALRGDMRWIDRTPVYTETATLRVEVTDSAGAPVPDAYVDVTSLWPPATRGWTGADGVLELLVGEGVPFGVQVTVGEVKVPPVFPALAIPEGAAAGETVTWSAELPPQAP